MNASTSIKETALITGASRGIGLALAREFASHGHALVLVARDGGRLNAVAGELTGEFGVGVRAIALDLSQPEAPQALFDEVQQAGIKVDILVNNAGIAHYGKFADSDLAQDLRLMQLNMVSLTHLTKLFLQPMLQRQSGRIVNVSSLGGYQPGGPLWAVYFASKSYVLSFTKALGVELRGSGVSATAVCPGATSTDFVEANHVGNTLLYRLFATPPEKIARPLYRGIMRRRTAVIPGAINTLLAIAGELPPRRIALEVNHLLMK